MHRLSMAMAVATAAGLGLTACGDSRDSLPTSPQFARPAPPPSFACDFGAAKGFARSYFRQPTQNVVVDLINTMESAADPARTARGLDVFNAVAQPADVIGSPEVGSSLLNSIAACGSLGATAAIDWTGALGLQGAFAVVGDGSANVSGPVYAKDLFSAVAPPAGKSWSGWLRLPNTGLPEARAVVYGAPFSVTSDLSPEQEIGSRGFDWSTLPARPFPFGNEANDDGFFGICVSSATTERIQNNHGVGIQGILGSYDPGNPPLELSCEGFSDDGQPGTLGLLRRAMDLLSPRPAYAATLAGKGTGGTPGGYSRHFVVKPTALKVTVSRVKDGKVAQTLNAPDGITVTVATVPPNNQTGVALQLVAVTIEIAGNNGVPANFTGTKTILTNESGVATFSDLQLFSAGGYTLRAFTTDGLAGLPATEGLSNAFHIKNK